jgi:hypothetical protein
MKYVPKVNRTEFAKLAAEFAKLEAESAKLEV